MKTQTLKIEIPRGFEVDTFDKSTGEIKLKQKPLNVMERIKDVNDVLADNGLTLEQFNSQCHDLTGDERSYRLLKLLAKSLNEGWEPDWSDSNELKYFPWFEMRGSSGFRFDDFGAWNSLSIVGSRLCFKTRELAEHAGKQFANVYKQFMVIE